MAPASLVPVLRTMRIIGLDTESNIRFSGSESSTNSPTLTGHSPESSYAVFEPL